jgi:2TM domain-containing protein
MTDLDPGVPAREEPDLRQRALQRLKKRHDFYGHLLVWAFTGGHGFFWPIFPIVGWGIGVIMNAWDVFGSNGYDEEKIKREMEHLRSR